MSMDNDMLALARGDIDLGERVMRMSSSLVAWGVAILSTALLCGLGGAAMSQTATGSGTQLPNVTARSAEASGKAATTGGNVTWVRSGRTPRPEHRDPLQVANGTPSYARGSVMYKLAKLERGRTSATMVANPASDTARTPGLDAADRRGTLSFLSNLQRHTHPQGLRAMRGNQMFLGWDRQRSWWYCTGMLNGGKFRVTAQNRNRDTR